MKTPLLKGLQVAAVCAVVLATNPSDAAVVGGSFTGRIGSQPLGNSNITVFDPPPSYVAAQNFEGDSVFAFNEKQNLRLTQEIRLWDGYVPSDFEGGVGRQPTPPNLTISSGTLISSHFIFVDPPGTSLAGSKWDGTITFDSDILGIIPTIRTVNGLDATHALLAPEDTQFGRLGYNGLDNIIDTLSFSGSTLTFSLWTADGMDPFRVITHGNQVANVPEPITLLGTGTALGFVPLLKQAYSRKKKVKRKDES
ncbi:PEP-CTERM sorting domain-containing protein [Coleofasciculus chthonoplastes]|uniref:PEP-CTERM sorting domain-containing protein n=1 Tax=Coleofasciculus chthonoplastes TaxID=64178 RepID=UPI003303FF4E